MRVFKFSLVATVMVCALAVTAHAADCGKVTALGKNFTHDTAVLFSTHALANSLSADGLVGKGPVQTKCETGPVMITCYSSQMACKGGTPKACLGPWLCF
jgi:hypothetical protein